MSALPMHFVRADDIDGAAPVFFAVCGERMQRATLAFAGDIRDGEKQVSHAVRAMCERCDVIALEMAFYDPPAVRS